MGKLARGLGVPAQRRCRGSMSTDEQRAKTLSSILKSVARHHKITVEELLRELDL